MQTQETAATCEEESREAGYPDFAHVTRGLSKADSAPDGASSL